MDHISRYNYKYWHLGHNGGQMEGHSPHATPRCLCHLVLTYIFFLWEVPPNSSPPWVRESSPCTSLWCNRTQALYNIFWLSQLSPAPCCHRWFRRPHCPRQSPCSCRSSPCRCDLPDHYSPQCAQLPPCDSSTRSPVDIKMHGRAGGACRKVRAKWRLAAWFWRKMSICRHSNFDSSTSGSWEKYNFVFAV